MAGELADVGDLARRAVVARPGVEERDQDGEIVVVAEGLREHVELVGEWAEHAGRGVVEQLHLVPEVLDGLAPLVDLLVGRLGPHPPQRGSTPLVGRR